MDEKWFYEIVVCHSNKCVPHLGINSLNINVHHKAHIYKNMGIVTSTFAPHNNNMTKDGGLTKSICLGLARW